MAIPVLPSAHQDLTVWHRADDLAQHIYRLTWKFMQTDSALAQRMRSGAITVAASIAEACRAGGRVRSRRALQVASAALGELGYYLHFARRAGLLGDADLKRVGALESEVRKYLDPLLTSRDNLENAGS